MNDSRYITSPEDIKEAGVFVYALSMGGSAYGRISDRPEEQVFIPKSVAEKFDMRPGDVFKCRIAANYPDRRDQIPWRMIYVYPAETPAPTPPAAQVAEQKKEMTVEELRKRVEDISTDGRVWTSRLLFETILGRDVDYKNKEDSRMAANIGNILRTMSRNGKLWQSELGRLDAPAHAVYFCADREALKPEGF